MNSRRTIQIIPVLILAVVVFASCTPVSGLPFALSSSSPGITLPENSNAIGSTPAEWIAIDPIPVLEANESFRIAGTTSLPEGEYLNIHIHLSFSDPEAVAAGRTSVNGFIYTPVMTEEGRNTWKADIDPQRYKPDLCTVDVVAVKHSVYATVISPSSFPQSAEPDTPYWIKLNATGTHDLNESFTITGSSNLPADYPVMVEVYPGIFTPADFGSATEYQPVLQEITQVQWSEDDSGFISLPVNLTGHTERNGRPLSPGTYFTEVHAVNLNSTVSDNGTFTMTTAMPWVTIDPFDEPVKGTNLTISGTTDLLEGENIFLYLGTYMHPCPTYRNPPDYDTQWTCGGSNCSSVNVYETIPVVNATRGIRTWSYTISTENWCLNESYYLRVSTGENWDAPKDVKYFHINAA